MHSVFKTLGNEIARFLTFGNWLLPMPSPHISSVHFGESVLLGDMALGSHAEPRRRWRSLGGSSLFRVSVAPRWLKGATHILKSIILLGVELAGTGNPQEQQTRSALSTSL